MSEARGFWWRSAGAGEILGEPLGVLGQGECLIAARCSSISLGTERLVATGQVPEAMGEAMRCPHMGGAFPFPVKYGYSLVGEVIEGPAWLLGRLVHALHPHQDRCRVAAAEVFEVPEGVTEERATLASNLETAVTALWDARVLVGERALVVGFGIVGSLIARLLASVPGVRLVVADSSPEKLAMAQAMGFEATAPGELSGGFDLAFHASGSSGGLQASIDQVGFEGRVIEVSWYGSRAVEVHLGATFHSQRKSILCSQVSNLPPHQRGRWDYRRRKALVFDLLKDPGFDAHLTDRIAFEALPGWFSRALADPPVSLAQLVVYEGQVERA